MANILDYLKWRGDLDFSTVPLNPVDNVIFCQLSYLTLDGIVPCPEDTEGITINHMVEIYNENLKRKGGFISSSLFKQDPEFIKALGSSKRFGKCLLFGYVNQIETVHEKQFSAISILINKENYFIAFRGTDSSIIGWKEDLNMSFQEIIPSQTESVKYLETIAGITKGSLYIGGHSKGGNLAIYAASFCSKQIKKRIKNIYNNDGPGFHEKIIKSEGFNEIKNRINCFVPQSSIVGMFLEHGSDYTVIKSSQSGIMQHDLYSWDVMYDNLIYIDKITISSQYVNRTIREWLGSLDNKHRRQFIDAVYQILNTTGAQTIYDIELSWIRSAYRILKSYRHIDQQTKKLIRKTIYELFRCAGTNFGSLLAEGQNE